MKSILPYEILLGQKPEKSWDGIIIPKSFSKTLFNYTNNYYYLREIY